MLGEEKVHEGWSGEEKKKEKETDELKFRAGWSKEEENEVQIQEEMIRKTMRKSRYEGMEIIDWDKKIKEHRLGI